MDILKFEELVKKIDKKKYHINRELAFDKNNFPYLKSWSIFRINMKPEDYYDPKNLVILSSKNKSTLEDIEKLIKDQ